MVIPSSTSSEAAGGTGPEQVAETFAQIDTPGGEMRAYVAHPLSNAAAPTVVLFPDVLGLHGEIRGFVRRVAGYGYLCIAPEVYHRIGIDTVAVEHTIPEMSATAKTLVTTELVEDIGALFHFADEFSGAPAIRPKCCIGFCRGGSQAFLAAGAFPEHVVGAVSAYGTRLMQDSPDTAYFRYAASISGELHLLCGAEDPLMPRDQIDQLRQHLTDHGVRFEITIVAAEHGWNFPSRHAYDRNADDMTWRVAHEQWSRLLSGDDRRDGTDG